MQHINCICYDDCILMMDMENCLGVYDEGVYTTHITDLDNFVTCFNCNITTEGRDVEDGPYMSVMNSIMNILENIKKEGTSWNEVIGISSFLLQNVLMHETQQS